MKLTRRHALNMTALAGAGSAIGLAPVRAAEPAPLVNLVSGAKPITPEERLTRIHLLQAALRKAGLGAILIEPGSSLLYFTGIAWWRSERVTALVVPADGEPLVVTPFFEAPSIREMLAIPAAIRTWDEPDNPMAVVAGWLREQRLTRRGFAIEETVREFIRDGLQRQLPDLSIRSGADIVRPIRMRKSPAELALMQLAATITANTMRYTAGKIERGMTPAQINAIMAEATKRQGAEGGNGLVLLGEAAAYPHGTHQRQEVRDGDVILLDAGCTVHGYVSDISRSFVLGEPGAELRKVWQQVRTGQQIAFDAARPGTPCGAVDDAVRRYYERLGYGPGYKLPGLSHRTGHGIGMDGHEPVNLVHGEKTPLDAGMCFSNEPGIYIPGQFGVRLEDCFYMTTDGPRWFTTPPTSIDHPFD